MGTKIEVKLIWKIKRRMAGIPKRAYKYWIPAFAGMTWFWTISYIQDSFPHVTPKSHIFSNLFITFTKDPQGQVLCQI